MQTLRNISDFENVPKRGWLLVGNGLENNEVDFKVDAGPDREPVEISVSLMLVYTWALVTGWIVYKGD